MRPPPLQYRIQQLPKSSSGRGLQTHNALGLQAFGSLLHLEFDRLAFVKGLVPISLNGRKVNENVLARLSLNESITLGCIEPLDCTLLSTHFWCSYFIHKAELSRPLAGTAPKAICGLGLSLQPPQKKADGRLPGSLVGRVKRKHKSNKREQSVPSFAPKRKKLRALRGMAPTQNSA